MHQPSESTPIKILDHGEIQLIDLLGDDLRIVQSARVSYGNDVLTQTEATERDEKLIHFLLSNDHGSPFESVVFQFRIKCPIFVMRQWIRHRIASYNEISGRYTQLTDEFYIPEQFRTQSKANKQASDQPFENPDLIKEITSVYHHAYQTYQNLIHQGVAREMARIVLPLATYTEFYWTINVRSLMNFLKLRMDKHAQWEIQQYALRIFEIFQHHLPITAQAFQSHLQ